MIALGPRTLAAIADGWQRGTGDNLKAQREWAERVAEIAVEEKRERCAKICEDLDSRTIISEDRQGSAIECADAIREGR